MKTILNTFLFFCFSASLLSGACKKETCEAKYTADCICTMQYDPVCGCDGKTYGNACEAGCWNVTYVPGECK